MTSTHLLERAEFMAVQPPISAKRSRSPNALNWLVQNSGVSALPVTPSIVDAGMSIFLPPWTKNWVILLEANCVTTLEGHRRG